MGEACDLLKLSVPIFIARLSWVGMKITDTALLGHVGTHYLSATALSDLWTQSTGVFIMSRVAGIFCGQAVGAGNKKLAGVWLQVSYAVLGAILLPVAALWLATTPVLRRLFGVDWPLARDAGYYARALCVCLPARVAFSQLSVFFQSQRIMQPSVVASFVALCCNVLFGYLLVLGTGAASSFHGLGFHACPWVTTAMEYVQVGVLYFVFCRWQRLHAPCWPDGGWSRSHITRERVRNYWSLYWPAALSIASDFWRFSLIGAFAAHMGADQVAVFNASYRILWFVLTFVGSLAGAVGIKLGLAFGANAPRRARRSAATGIAVAAAAVAVLGLLLYLFPRALARVFSDDPRIVGMFAEVRVPLAFLTVAMTMSVTLEKIPLAMGRTKAVLYCGLVGSWVGQVPGVLLCTRFWRDDLVGLYTGTALGYALLCAIFLALIARSDFAVYAHEAQARSEVANTKDGGAAAGGGRDQALSNPPPPYPKLFPRKT